VQAGDDAWGAIELTDGDHTLARLFPKGGLIKIDSLDAELNVAAFGPNLELNKSREWVLRLADSNDVASAVDGHAPSATLRNRRIPAARPPGAGLVPQPAS